MTGIISLLYLIIKRKETGVTSSIIISSHQIYKNASLIIYNIYQFHIILSPNFTTVGGNFEKLRPFVFTLWKTTKSNSYNNQVFARSKLLKAKESILSQLGVTNGFEWSWAKKLKFLFSLSKYLVYRKSRC